MFISFVDSALWKAVAAPHAVNDDANVTGKGSEVQVGVPGRLLATLPTDFLISGQREDKITPGGKGGGEVSHG